MDGWIDGRMAGWMDRVSSGSRPMRHFDHTGSQLGCQSEAMTTGKCLFPDGKGIDSMVWDPSYALKPLYVAL